MRNKLIVASLFVSSLGLAANPDLPARFAKKADLNVPDANTFYSAGVQGYTDYASL